MERPTQTQEERIREVVKKMADKWPSGIVARKDIDKFTGGLISPKTMLNIDGKGEGPKERISNGNRVAYEMSVLCDWLVEVYGLLPVTSACKPLPEILRK